MKPKRATRVTEVVAALIERDARVVICQRTRHQTMPLKWEFPGGKIEHGEDPRAALERELDEELGITPTVGAEVARLRHAYRNGDVVRLRFYLVRHWEREIENRIFRDVRWVRPKELLTYDFLEADLPLVRDLAKGQILTADLRG